MKREYFKWYSSILERDMELLVYGHADAKVLVFPTRNGRFYEYEKMRMPEVMRHKIEAGQLQFFCVDGIDPESFYCDWAEPRGRLTRHMQYEAYIISEVIPFIHSLNPHECLISHGCSLGGYHATTVAFRHPELFQKLVCFSGRFDLTVAMGPFRSLLDDYYDEDVYFYMPSYFMPRLEDAEILGHLKRMDMVFVIGVDDPFRRNNEEMMGVLDSKGIDFQFHYWREIAHRASYWREMGPCFI